MVALHGAGLVTLQLGAHCLSRSGSPPEAREGAHLNLTSVCRVTSCA